MPLTLHGFGPALGLPDISPFCSKIDTYLRMAGIPFETSPGNPRVSPKGKLPYINHDGHLLSDSTQIIAYLQQHFPQANDLHPELTAQQQAIATMTKGAVEEKLYFGILYQRWQDPENWKLYKDVISGALQAAGVPSLIAPILAKQVRKSVVKTLKGQGMGRHTPEEVDQICRSVIDAIAALLDQQNYFFGETPHAIDAMLFAFVDAIVTPPLPSPTQDHTKAHANLNAYVARVRRQFFST